jgi:hypothetical protein
MSATKNLMGNVPKATPNERFSSLDEARERSNP